MLLSPSVKGLQELLSICEQHAQDTDLVFSTDRENLGTTLTSTCSLASDVMEKRAKFISKVYSLNQEFCFAFAETRLRLWYIYNTAFFGSNCWKFSSAEVEKFGKTWNVNHRIMFNLPRETHSWIVEELTGAEHSIQMIYSRFVKYLSVIKNNKKLIL